MPVYKRDVTSLSKSGSAKLKGDVTLSEGDGVTLTQSGQDIEITAAAGAGDMAAATYDPQNVADDAFDTDNHTDGTVNKVYTATEKTKLAGIETGADVTDTANVTSAGALMDSEVDADIKTLSLPASTTITAAAATVLDDTTVGDMVNTLGGATSTGTGGLVRATSPALVTPTGIVKGDVGLGNVDNTSDATKQAATLLAAFPVGSIYTTTSSTNPGTFLGGTWAAFGAGRVLVGFDSGQTEFDTDEETGGAKTHTLTEAEMPAHTHNLTSQTLARGGAASGASNLIVAGDRSIATATALSTGGGGAHNNLQPYITVRFWKRTA